MQSSRNGMVCRTALVGAVLAALALPAKAEQTPTKTVRSASRTVTVTADVVSIDLPSRTVVLRSDEGSPVTLKVDERARNLPQVRVGDRVKARYVESVVVRLHKEGAIESGAAVIEGASRTALGEKPGGAVTRQVTIVAPIVAIDTATLVVTLRGVEGTLVRHKVRDAALLEGVSVGDQVEMAYTEAVAIEVATITPTAEELNRSELSRIGRGQADGK